MYYFPFFHYVATTPLFFCAEWSVQLMLKIITFFDKKERWERKSTGMQNSDFVPWDLY